LLAKGIEQFCKKERKKKKHRSGSFIKSLDL